MNYYNEIKSILIDNAIGRKVREYKSNQKDLESYYNVGKLLVEAQGGEERAKYGNGLIKEYSKKLTEEIGRGYTYTNLSRMRQFYIMFENVVAMPQQLTWSHINAILQ